MPLPIVSLRPRLTQKASIASFFMKSPSLLAELWKEYRGSLCAYLPKVGKEIRFAAQSAKIESGLILACIQSWGAQDF
jgi:hypothetical protein